MLAQEQEALLYDHEDTLVFQIRDSAGKLIAGVPDLPAAPPMEAGQSPLFFDAVSRGSHCGRGNSRGQRVYSYKSARR